MKLLLLPRLAVALILASMAVRVQGQVTDVGAAARNFSVVNRATRQPIWLKDFAGRIVVLDFFTYWCGPCKLASADIENNLTKFYADHGGNPAHIPVTVIGINIDTGQPARTDDFVRRAGLELTADDGDQEAFSQFDVQNAVPLVVVINGVPGRRQWEVLYRKAGYEGAQTIRRVIDSVGGPVSEKTP